MSTLAWVLIICVAAPAVVALALAVALGLCRAAKGN